VREGLQNVSVLHRVLVNYLVAILLELHCL